MLLTDQGIQKIIDKLEREKWNYYLKGDFKKFFECQDLIIDRRIELERRNNEFATNG